MSERSAYFKIKSTVEALGFQLCRPLPAGSTVPATFDGGLQVGHKKVSVRLQIPDFTFVERPKVHLLDLKQMPSSLISHIEIDDGICYAPSGLLRLDRYNPGGSILLVLKRATHALERSLKGRAATEIEAEYAAYWKGELLELISGAETDGPITFILPANSDVKGSCLLVRDAKSVPAGYQQGQSAVCFLTETPLHPSDDIISPRDLESLKRWFEVQDISDRVSWQRLMQLLASRTVVFFMAPNAISGLSVRFQGQLEALRKRDGSVKPSIVHTAMQKRPETFTLVRYGAADARLKSLVRRNMEETAASLIGKRIALVGCGSIGSHLARQLVQLGAGCEAVLDLIDPEVLSSANLGRHGLDMRHVGQFKAEGLASSLSEFHPDVQIKPRVGPASKFADRLRKADLIVDATGIEHVSDALNFDKLSDDAYPPIIHTWLFGNGICAQAFANLGKPEKACYRCLRPDLDAPWRFDPRSKDHREDNVIIGTCGDGVYLPYGVYAPITAAALAAQMVHDWANETPGSLFRTRTLDPERAVHIDDQSPSPDKRCPACQQ